MNNILDYAYGMIMGIICIPLLLLMGFYVAITALTSKRIELGIDRNYKERRMTGDGLR